MTAQKRKAEECNEHCWVYPKTLLLGERGHQNNRYGAF